MFHKCSKFVIIRTIDNVKTSFRCVTTFDWLNLFSQPSQTVCLAKECVQDFAEIVLLLLMNKMNLSVVEGTYCQKVINDNYTALPIAFPQIMFISEQDADESVFLLW